MPFSSFLQTLSIVAKIAKITEVAKNQLPFIHANQNMPFTKDIRQMHIYGLTLLRKVMYHIIN